CCRAEDGIRERNVTGVQTCALPICARTGSATSGVQPRTQQGRGAVGGRTACIAVDQLSPTDPGGHRPCPRGVLRRSSDVRTRPGPACAVAAQTPSIPQVVAHGPDRWGQEDEALAPPTSRWGTAETAVRSEGAFSVRRLSRYGRN